MYEEFQLECGDGVRLSSHLWSPDGGEGVKACIVIIHGQGEHAMRYDDYARYFVGMGIAVFSMDLRGHGKSPGVKGHVAPRSRVLDDIDLLCRRAGETFPDRPIFMYGHSLGGNLALSHRLYGTFKPAGYVITSPWLILYRPQPWYKLAMLRLIAAIKPDITIKTGLAHKDISSVESEVELYSADSLIHGYISLGAALDCLSYSKEILKRAGEDHGRLLLMHGTEDHICSVEGSRRFSAKAGTLCEYREWEGCRHELQHDVSSEDARSAIADWILGNS